MPAEADLRAALASAATVAVTPWSEHDHDRALMETPPPAGRVESRRELPDVGVTVVRFANGVEAWLKPTDFKNDQVLFTMYAPGGASLAPTGRLSRRRGLPASTSELSGARRLQGASISTRCWRASSPRRRRSSSMSTHGISGFAVAGGPRDGAAAALPGVHGAGRRSGSVRADEAPARGGGRQPRQKSGPGVRREGRQVNTSNHYTSQPLTAEARRDARSREDARRSTARGSPTPPTSRCSWSARSRPRRPCRCSRSTSDRCRRPARKSSQFKDVGVRFPTAIERAKVEKGREPRSQTDDQLLRRSSRWIRMEQERSIAATSVLQTVLRDTLREDLGQTYTVSVGLSQSLPQRGDGHIAGQFRRRAGKHRGDDRLAFSRRSSACRTRGRRRTSSRNAKEGARRDYETALKQNGYWMRRLQSIHMLGGDPSDILTRTQRIDAVTATGGEGGLAEISAPRPLRRGDPDARNRRTLIRCQRPSRLARRTEPVGTVSGYARRN